MESFFNAGDGWRRGRTFAGTGGVDELVSYTNKKSKSRTDDRVDSLEWVQRTF